MYMLRQVKALTLFLVTLVLLEVHGPVAVSMLLKQVGAQAKLCSVCPAAGSVLMCLCS